MPSIGGYQLLGLLGRGGMGSVYKVMDPVNNRLRAMKVLRPVQIMQDVLGFEELKKRFQREAAIMIELKHRHVARVLEMGEHGPLPFMVQEYLCLNLGLLIGESTRVEQPTRPLSPLKALGITSQVLDCLAGLHEAGLIHRDIKPENIMLDRNGEVKVIDFGLSRFVQEKERNPAGMIIGSPYYAAPEQVDDSDRADERSDIYSVGVVLYRMVTGHLPGVSEVDIKGHALLGPRWQSVMDKALAPEPDRRFADWQVMKREIRLLEKDWKKRRDQVCVLSRFESRKVKEKFSGIRDKPVRTGKAGGPPSKKLNTFMQPETYLENEFHKIRDGVLDHAAGLIWSGDVSFAQLNYEQVQSYIRGLNRHEGSCGQAGSWRLPTVDELISLLEPRQSLEDFCSPDFWNLKNRSWLWSADTQTRTKAWVVDMEQGAVLPLDRMCMLYVLPVRQYENREGG
jgi:serine/threonine protein kinase